MIFKVLVYFSDSGDIIHGGRNSTKW